MALELTMPLKIITRQRGNLKLTHDDFFTACYAKRMYRKLTDTTKDCKTIATMFEHNVFTAPKGLHKPKRALKTSESFRKDQRIGCELQ